jgi:hypothetical protein
MGHRTLSVFPSLADGLAEPPPGYDRSLFDGGRPSVDGGLHGQPGVRPSEPAKASPGLQTANTSLQDMLATAARIQRQLLATSSGGGATELGGAGTACGQGPASPVSAATATNGTPQTSAAAPPANCDAGHAIPAVGGPPSRADSLGTGVGGGRSASQSSGRGPLEALRDELFTSATAAVTQQSSIVSNGRMPVPDSRTAVASTAVRSSVGGDVATSARATESPAASLRECFGSPAA